MTLPFFLLNFIYVTEVTKVKYPATIFAIDSVIFSKNIESLLVYLSNYSGW